MNLRNLLIYIMKNYDTTENFKNNDVANKIRKEIKSSFPLNSNRLEFKGSPGQGAWAEIPWIGLFDKKYYKVSAQRGIYVVYLLSSDHKSMYLSLMQGWTNYNRKYGFDKGKKIVQNVNQKIRKFITKNDLDSDNHYENTMDLKSKNPNAIGYEIVNIICKEYQLESMPSNYEMENDLQNMIYMLKFVNDSEEIKSLIEEYYAEDDESLNKNDDSLPQKRAVKVEPHHGVKKTKRKYSGKSVKIDYDKINKANKDLGDNGEEWILNREKQYLLDKHLDELANKVKRVSKDGDGKGYDILSFDEFGNERYIEVKTTSGDINVSFPISINELLASKIYSNNYHLYRVFNYDKNDMDKIQYYSLHGDMYALLNLEGTQFSAIPK